MSDFVQQNATEIAFVNSENWIILSPIELSIKHKIEAIGTPLRDWDIQINYGIKTGYNDAFIITTETRNKILAACIDESERARTEELIRPILRGRDIKRYGYDWANLWIIATFPVRKYNIDDYPAVKHYLLTFAEQILREAGYDWIADNYLNDFCYQKLAQSGEYVEICGKRVRLNSKDEKARKKTSNKWFETQDSISYWDDFNQPKIVYMEIQTDNPEDGYIFPCYSYDSNRSIILNTGYIISSETIDVRYLLGVLNSKIGRFLTKLYVTQLQERQFRMLAQYVSKFPIPKPTIEQQDRMVKVVDSILAKQSIRENEAILEALTLELFGLTKEEYSVVIEE